MRLLQSLSRGLQTLDYLSEQSEPARLTDIAAALGVEKSNASHVLKTLVAGGYASQDANRRYSFAKPMPSLGDQHSLEAIVACKEARRPVLERLFELTGECSHLAVLVRSRVWYIDKIDSELPLKVDHPIGSLSPLHCTALGKAFLAFGGATPDRRLKKYTAKTITDHKLLASEIERTRQLGYAIDDEEFAPGVRCVARPVHTSEGGMIAAVGLSGPTARIGDDRITQLGELMCEIELGSARD